MLYEPMSQPSGYEGGYLHGPGLWSWEQTHVSLCGSQIPLPSERPKRGSEASEEWDVLVPLKKLRLTEAPLCETEEMAIDDADRNSDARCPVGSPSAMTDSEDAPRCSDQQQGDAKPSGQGETSQERRAKIQQRAWEEMRKYRQALRNCESGMVIRDCA